MDILDRTINYSEHDKPLMKHWNDAKAVCVVLDKHGCEAREVHTLVFVMIFTTSYKSNSWTQNCTKCTTTTRWV